MYFAAHENSNAATLPLEVRRVMMTAPVVAIVCQVCGSGEWIRCKPGTASLAE
jgi:hypothetical protein